MEVVSGDSWSYETCKAPVKSSLPTNQHPVVYSRMSFLSPNQQCQSTEGNSLILTQYNYRPIDETQENVSLTFLEVFHFVCIAVNEIGIFPVKDIISFPLTKSCHIVVAHRGSFTPCDSIVCDCVSGRQRAQQRDQRSVINLLNLTRLK